MMPSLSVGDILAIIGGVAGGVVLIINALGQWWGRKDIAANRVAIDRLTDSSTEAGKKLDVIHSVTNGAMTAMRQTLAAAQAALATAEQTLLTQNARVIELEDTVRRLSAGTPV